MDEQAVSIQWFPGHMAKTRRLMKESLRLVDIVVELIDARIPNSSRNPEIDKLVGRLPRIVVLNKSDMADEQINRQWVEYFKGQGVFSLAADCRSGRGLKGFLPLVQQALKGELEKRRARGMDGKPIRMMIVGIPNVGKSSFINRMAKSKRAQVADRPGVTRGKQWVKIDGNIDLLDMPGVLWPKFEDQQVAEHLAFCGAIKDDILDIEELACQLIKILVAQYPQMLKERFGIAGFEQEGPYEVLQMLGRKRGMLLAGGEVNTERMAITLLDEFRGGKLGRISLEKPEDITHGE